MHSYHRSIKGSRAEATKLQPNGFDISPNKMDIRYRYRYRHSRCAQPMIGCLHYQGSSFLSSLFLDIIGSPLNEHSKSAKKSLQKGKEQERRKRMFPPP